MWSEAMIFGLDVGSGLRRPEGWNPVQGCLGKILKFGSDVQFRLF